MKEIRIQKATISLANPTAAGFYQVPLDLDDNDFDKIVGFGIHALGFFPAELTGNIRIGVKEGKLIHVPLIPLEFLGYDFGGLLEKGFDRFKSVNIPIRRGQQLFLNLQLTAAISSEDLELDVSIISEKIVEGEDFYSQPLEYLEDTFRLTFPNGKVAGEYNSDILDLNTEYERVVGVGTVHVDVEAGLPGTYRLGLIDSKRDYIDPIAFSLFRVSGTYRPDRMWTPIDIPIRDNQKFKARYEVRDTLTQDNVIDLVVRYARRIGFRR